MSRTFRNTNRFNGNWRPKGHKLKPYLAKKDTGDMKFAPELSSPNPHGTGYPGFKLGISKTGKLVAKNANRSKKKAARQESKKIINTQLKEEPNDWEEI